MGDLLAEHVLGAKPGEVLVCDSVTVNLQKLAGAVLQEEPGPIAALAEDFPTDRYVLQGLAHQHNVELRLVSRAQLPLAAQDARLVCLSHVDYRSGEVAELGSLHAPKGLVLWDLSHSAGAVELDLEGSGADLAVGCTYKYLDGGPGAPAYLYVRTEHQDRLRSPIQGWFGQKEQFEMGLRYEPADGIRRFLAGTPPILSLTAVEAAVKLIGQAGMAVIAPKTRALTELFVYLHDQWLSDLGFKLASPRGAGARGGHVRCATSRPGRSPARSSSAPASCPTSARPTWCASASPRSTRGSSTSSTWPSACVSSSRPASTRRSTPRGAASRDRDVLDGPVVAARALLDLLDPPVEHRAHEDQQLTDELGELRAQLRRDDVAQHRDDVHERVELVAGLLGAARNVPAARRDAGRRRLLGEPLRRLLRRAQALAEGLEGLRVTPRLSRPGHRT